MQRPNRFFGYVSAPAQGCCIPIAEKSCLFTAQQCSHAVTREATRDDNETRSINRQRNRLLCFLRAPKSSRKRFSSAVSEECGEEKQRNGSDKISTSSQKRTKVNEVQSNLHKLPETPKK